MMLSRVDIALPLLERDRVRTRHFADFLTQPLLIWFPLIAATILIGQDYLGQVVVCNPYPDDSRASIDYVNTLCGTTTLDLKDSIFLMFDSATRVSLRQLPLLLIFQALAFRLLIFAWDVAVGDKLVCLVHEWDTMITDLTEILCLWYKSVQEDLNCNVNNKNKVYSSNYNRSFQSWGKGLKRQQEGDIVDSRETEKQPLNVKLPYSIKVHPYLIHAQRVVMDARELLTDWLDTRARLLYLRFLAYTLLSFTVCSVMAVVMGSVNSLLPHSPNFNCSAPGREYRCVYRFVTGLRVAIVCNMGFFVVGAGAHLLTGVYLTIPMSPLNSFFCHKVPGLYYSLKNYDKFYHKGQLGMRLLSLYLAHNKCQLKNLERMKRFTRMVKEKHLYTLQSYISQSGGPDRDVPAEVAGRRHNGTCTFVYDVNPKIVSDIW